MGLLKNLGLSLVRLVVGSPDMLDSKKWKATLGAVGFLLLNQALVHFGLPSIDMDTQNKIIALLGTFVLGQGIADHGKEAAKLQAAALDAAQKAGKFPKAVK